MRTATQVDIQACKDFLLTNEYAVIATARGGEPSSAVVTYLADDAWNIYFFTRKNTHKHQNLTKNQAISLVIGTGPASTTVQINGTASALSELEHEQWMGEFLTKRDGFYMTFLKLRGYDFIGYKATPNRIRWLHIPVAAEHEEIVEIPLV